MGGARRRWDRGGMPDSSSPIPRRRVRLPLVVAGSLTAIIATLSLVAGGVALWADGKKDADGYLSTHRHEFTARTAALATKNLDIDLDGAHWVLDSGNLGKVRLQVASRTSRPVFVGIARTREVNAYLRGVAHTTLTDLNSDPFKATYRDHGGRRVAAPPARRTIWAASAHGRGTQTLRWRVRNGSWSVVVMNADGSPGVRADIRAGARIPFLSAVGWSAIGAGAFFVVVAGALFAVAIGPRPQPPAPSAEVVPAAS
jgi:hypothetical protein